MFEAFYNLSSNPFRLTPDPEFCFHHPSHDQAYAYLQYALRLGEGFIMVTGRPGIGKTTLVEVFLSELKHTEVVAARVASANVEADDLMRVVAYSYGINVEGLDKATILLRLRQFFIDRTTAGKRVLLIIDEAQGLPWTALEELRLLADLQMDSRPLLQLFLVGQEKLRKLMHEPSMEQFQQRIIGACHIDPLCLSDTRAYLEHRLRKAGWQGDPGMTGEAVHAIYEFSRGVPRHVNKICTRLLLDGFMQKKHLLDRGDVLEVAEALRSERLAPLGEPDRELGEKGGTAPCPDDDTIAIADLALRAGPPEPEATGPAAAASRKPASAEPPPGEEEHRTTTREGPKSAFGRQPPVSGSVPPASPPPRRAVPEPESQRRQPQHTSIPDWAAGPAQRPKRRTGGLATTINRTRERLAGSGRLHLYGRRIRRLLARHAGFDSRIALWVAATAMTTLALTLFLGPHREDNGNHSAMLEVGPPIAPRPAAVDAATAPPAHTQEAQPADPVRSGTTPPAAADTDSGARFGDGTRPAQREPLPVAGEERQPVQAAAPLENTDEAATAPAIAVAPTGKGEKAENDEAQPAPPAAVAASTGTGVEQAESAGATAVAVEDSSQPVVAEPRATAAATSKAPVQIALAEHRRVAPPLSREDRIIDLLSRAQRALRNDRLLLPQHDNAFRYYQQVLTLEPHNRAALFGMDQIVERYAVLARRALDRGDEARAKRYIARGFGVLPDDSRLLALQQRMEAPTVVEVPPEPAPEPVEPAEEKDAIKWIKGIFSRLRAGENTGAPAADDDL